MADDDITSFAPGALPPGAIPIGPDTGDAMPFAPSAVDLPPPAPANPPNLLERAWRSVADVPATVWRDITQPPAVAPELKDVPTSSPFFAGVAHGAREAIDQAAEKLTLGGEAVFGKGLVSKLPGYRSAEDIRADIAQRRTAYEAVPQYDAGSTGASIGRGVGAGLTLGGPLMKVGGLVAGGISRLGGAVVPGAMRGLEYLSGAAEAAPGASLPARLATRGASLSSQGAVTGGAIAGVQADPDKPILPQVAQGAGEGAIAAPVVGSAISAATYPARAALGQLPNMVHRGVVDLADRFVNQYGIRLDPTQLTTNPTYKLMTDQAGKMPLSGVGNRVAEARLQWQQALGREMGEAAPDGITHDLMNTAARRIGGTMDTIAARTTIQRDPALLNDMVHIVSDIPRFGLTEAQLTPVRAQFRNVLGAFQQGNGRISGEAYQNLTQTGGPLDAVISSTDPTVAAFGLRIRHALDDAFQRSAAPGDQAALQQARYQYRVMKTVQPLVEQRGPTGDIEPNNLLKRVVAQSHAFDPSTRGVAYTGGGPLGDLAYGGQIFFGRPAESGTAARSWVTAGLLGGGLATAMEHPTVPAATLTALLANRAAQKAMRSPAVGGSMIENTLQPPGPFVQQATPYVLPGLLNPYEARPRATR